MLFFLLTAAYHLVIGAYYLQSGIQKNACDKHYDAFYVKCIVFQLQNRKRKTNHIPYNAQNWDYNINASNSHAKIQE